MARPRITFLTLLLLTVSVAAYFLGRSPDPVQAQGGPAPICDVTCEPDPGGSGYGGTFAARPELYNARGSSSSIVPKHIGLTPGSHGLDPRPGPKSSSVILPGSESYNYVVPILSLPGRNGLDLSLTLYYSSRVWTIDKVNNTATFNADRDVPSYGFRLGFGYLEYDPKTNTVTCPPPPLLPPLGDATTGSGPNAFDNFLGYLFSRGFLAFFLDTTSPYGQVAGPAGQSSSGTPYVVLAVLDGCVQELFGVSLQSFTASRRGQNGQFVGYGPDSLQNRGNNATIQVSNDRTSFTSAQLNTASRRRLAPGTTIAGLTFQAGDPNRLVPTDNSPYINYTANNLGPMLTLENQVHELGHSLREITTGSPHESVENGSRLRNCVKSRGGFRTR